MRVRSAGRPASTCTNRVANHFSLAVDDAGTKFLMNPRGRHFSRIGASELLLLDAADEATMQRPDAPDPTAWALHGAIHRRVRHARCVLHVHSRYASVLACLADPALPPVDLNAMRFWGRMAIDDDLDGMGLDDEAERIARLVGDKPILLLRNHGVMAIGETVARTFDDLYYFERRLLDLHRGSANRPRARHRLRPGGGDDGATMARLSGFERGSLPGASGDPRPGRPVLSPLSVPDTVTRPGLAGTRQQAFIPPAPYASHGVEGLKHVRGT